MPEEAWDAEMPEVPFPENFERWQLNGLLVLFQTVNDWRFSSSNADC